MMAIGMSYDEYWNGDVRATRAYLEATKIQQKRQLRLINTTGHLFGRYFYEALCDVSPVLRAFAAKGARPIPYRDEPYEFADDDEDQTPEEQDEEEEAEIRRARAYMMQMDMVGKNWGTR